MRSESERVAMARELSQSRPAWRWEWTKPMSETKVTQAAAWSQRSAGLNWATDSACIMRSSQVAMPAVPKAARAKQRRSFFGRS